MKKILFVGLGSIGKRHLKNLAEIAKNRNEQFVFDALRSSHKELDSKINDLISTSYFDYDSIPNDYDIVFITNPTIKHFESIQKLAYKTKNMFIEKPIFEKSSYDLKSLNLPNTGIYYVACPLRYTSVYKKMAELAKIEKIYSVRAICSSYLPEWRKNTDYRNIYSAKKELGGGVGIDLIHEWDYLVEMFGFPEKIKTMQGKYSNLEISSEDLYISIAQYKEKLIELHLDYFGQVNKRLLEFYTDQDVIVGDFINNTIRFERSKKILDFSEDRNTYQIKELEEFLNMCDGKIKNTNTIEHSINVLKLAEGKER